MTSLTKIFKLIFTDMFMIDFLIIIGILWLIIASISDIKKREVANWLSFSLIIAGLVYRAFFSILNSDLWFFLFGLIGLAVFVALGYAFYYSRVFAGGDAKLLMALGVIIPFSYNFKSIFYDFALFLFLLLIVGAVYGVISSIVLSLKNWKLFVKEFKKQFILKKQIFYVSLVLTLFLALIILLFNAVYFLFLSVLILFTAFLFIYAKAVEEACMIKEIKAENLTEGDWLYEKIRIEQKIIKPHWEGLTEKQVKLIQKYGKNRKILIKQGVPFVPVFLIAFIIFFLLWNSKILTDFWFLKYFLF